MRTIHYDLTVPIENNEHYPAGSKWSLIWRILYMRDLELNLTPLITASHNVNDLNFYVNVGGAPNQRPFQVTIGEGSGTEMRRAHMKSKIFV